MSTPAELYRNAIDLNRYSNSVAARITRSYKDAIKETMQLLAALDAKPSATKSARLQGILANLKGSLDGWANASTALSVEELQELVEVQANFAAGLLKAEIPEDLRWQVRNVQISPQFAEAVATIDPTTYNVVTLSDDLGAAVTGTPKPFKLDLAGGSTITLPNGAGLATSFKRLAGKQAEIFTKEVRNGLILGDASPKIARRLRGQLTDVPSKQIKTMVRTSVNQVANAASQAVYTQNRDVTKKYKYVATLDSRTSPICRTLDGRTFEYGKGPTPPQHFNCRSTTRAFIDYEALGLKPPKAGMRAAEGGMIPADQSYGDWFKGRPRKEQEKILGNKGQVDYFNALAKKYGPDDAMRRFIREDGTQKTIADLKRDYGPVSSIKPKAKPKAKPKPVPKPAPQPTETLKPISSAGFKKAYQGKGQLNLSEVYEQQGFNAKSELVKDMDELLARKDLIKDVDGKDNLVFFRGIPQQSSVDQWQGRGSQGGVHYSGKGVYGNGSYMAAAGRSGKYSVEAAHSTATSYAGDKRSLVTASGLKKDARVWRTSVPVPKDNPSLDRAANNKAINAARMEAHNEWEKWSLNVVKEAKAKYGEDLNDIGEAAAALGYDAYQVPMANHGRGGSEDYWVVLNRGSLVSIEGPSPVPATRFPGDDVIFEAWTED